VVAAALWLGGCGWLGGARPTAVDDTDAFVFAQRIESFYELLEDVPVAAVTTYSDERLRAYFSGASAFEDYLASLASQVRRAGLRGGRAQRFVIEEFELTTADQGVVHLTIVGHHQRELRFWEMELPRTDTWKRVGDTWMLSPDRL
jgi:hypothetical protein